MAHDAKAIANYFLDAAQARFAAIDHMKLQKLIYFAHGWHLAFTDRPLISNDIQAWEYGPVIPTIYHEFKHFGPQPIAARAVEFDPSKGVFQPNISGATDERYVRHVLEEVWRVYGDYTSFQLSNMTHAPGTPWHKVISEFGGRIPPGLVIPNELIRAYFKAQSQG